MDGEVIAMGGAAWLRSRIASFPTKKEFVAEYIKSTVFPDKDQKTRALLLGQVYDLATKKK